MHKAVTFVLISLSVITGVLFVSILCYSFAAGYLIEPDIPSVDTPVAANLPTNTPLPTAVKTAAPTTQPSTKEPVEPNSANAPVAGRADNGLTWDGLQLDVTNVNYNAWSLIKAQNQYNDPPVDGKTMLMVTLRATNIEGVLGEPVRLWDSDIKLIWRQKRDLRIFQSGLRGCT